MTRLNLTTALTYQNIDTLTNCMSELMKGDGLDESDRFRATVCLAEVLNNIHEHSRFNRNNPKIVVTLYYQFKLQIFHLKVEHQAPEYEIKAGRLDEAFATSGRGWYIINAWMDQVAYRHSNGKNIIAMSKAV